MNVRIFTAKPLTGRSKEHEGGEPDWIPVVPADDGWCVVFDPGDLVNNIRIQSLPEFREIILAVRGNSYAVSNKGESLLSRELQKGITQKTAFRHQSGEDRVVLNYELSSRSTNLDMEVGQCFVYGKERTVGLIRCHIEK